MVNVIDIVALVNTILNNSNLEICQILSSDMDFNNELNVVDIVSIVQIIISKFIIMEQTSYCIYAKTIYS